MTFHQHNLNDRCRVKVTFQGLRIIEQKQLKSWAPHIDTSRLYPVDDNNWLEIQLWDLMNLFGTHSAIGMDATIENNFLIEERPRKAVGAPLQDSDIDEDYR